MMVVESVDCRAIIYELFAVGLLDQTTAEELISQDDVDLESSIARLKDRGAITDYQSKLILASDLESLKFGQLVVVDVLGQGGMGEVLLCDHPVLKKKVAVKVLNRQLAQDEGFRERFFREARAAAMLDHPNIVRVYDASIHLATPYIVMEYVVGRDLQQILNEHQRLEVAEAVDYVAQAALGLQHTFERGIVHRDIKPANLIRCENGRIKILDMGLALCRSVHEKNITETFDKGAIIGTVDYMAPEQFTSCSEVDVRADIYSLGVTLYALLCGKPPYRGDFTQKIVGHQRIEAVDLHLIDKRVPQGLDRVVRRAMAKNPAERFQQPIELARALRPWLGQRWEHRPELVLVAGKSKGDGGWTWKRWSRITQALSGVAILLVVLGSIWIWNRHQQSDSLQAIEKAVAKPGAQVTVPECRHDWNDFRGVHVRTNESSLVAIGQDLPTGWQLHTPREQQPVEVRGDEQLKCVVVAAKSEKTTAVLTLPPVRVSTGVTVPVFFNFRTEGGKLAVRIRNENGTVTVLNERLERSGWTRFSSDYVAQGSGAIIVELCFTSVSGEGKLFFDQIVVGGDGMSERELYRLNPRQWAGFNETTSAHQKVIQLPDTFQYLCWKPESVASVRFDAMERALVIQNISGEPSAMLFTPAVDSWQKVEYTCEFEYRMPATGKAFVMACMKDLGTVWLANLSGTDQWVKCQVEFTPLPGSVAPFHFELHNHTESGSGAIMVRDLVIRRRPATEDRRSNLLNLDDSRIREFDQQLSKMAVAGVGCQYALFGNWTADCWYENDTGRIALGYDQGNRYIALDNNPGSIKKSVQLFNVLEYQLQEGQRYLVRIGFKANHATEGHAVSLRYGVDPGNEFHSIKLRSCFEKTWQVDMADFVARESGPLGVFISNNRDPGQPLWIRSLVIEKID